MLKVGIVGCGSIANVHAWALSNMEDLKIVAMVDCVVERAQKLSQQYTGGEAKAFASLEEMLLEAAPDSVHICTPHYLHVPMAIEILKAGIHVFCEKPPAITMKQFEELSEAAASTQAKIGFCFQNRYNSTVKKAKEILEKGTLGRLIGARAFVTWKRDEEYYETDWKGMLSTEGGGALINQSIHTLDLLLSFLGVPKEVKASVHNHHLQGCIEVEDTVEAWMTFQNGERACFYASTGYATDAPVLLELTCEKGSITLMNQMVLVTSKEGCKTYLCEEVTTVGKNCWGNGHLTCIRDYYEKLNSKERFTNDLEGVKNTMQVMTNIYENRS